MRNTFHYKNEMDISFEKFLTNMQSIFTVFEDNYALLTEVQNILLLFQKVKSPILTQVKNSLQVSYKLYQDKYVCSRGLQPRQARAVPAPVARDWSGS